MSTQENVTIKLCAPDMQWRDDQIRPVASTTKFGGGH